MVYFFFLDYEIEFKIIFSLIFLIGFLSDIFILKKAIIKLFLQTITILIFIIYFDLKVNRSGIFFLDQLLNFDLFNYFFVIFCFIVLINGSNFIDGVNTNLLGYYFILLLIIFFTAENNNLEFNPNLIKILMLFIFFALTLNFFGIIFTGDAGAY